MPKTVLQSKFQEWKGLDRISSVVHDMKCIFREITKDDFGLDGEIEVVVPKLNGQGYETTGGIIKVQAKSGMSYVKEDNDATFSTPITRSDLDDWHNAPYPVFFIVYHPGDDRLYFKEIKAFVRSTPNVFQAPLRVVFEKRTDEFCKDAYDVVKNCSAVSPARVSTEQREKLFTNLLLVKKQPKYVYVAPTSVKTHAALKATVAGYVPPSTIVGGKLYTLANLHDDRCVLRESCDTREIDRVLTHRWASREEFHNEYMFILNQLLGSHLRRCGLVYNKDFKRNYFPRRNETDKVFLEDWFNVRTSRLAPARSVVKLYKYGTFQFWRHLAASLSFRRIGASLFLQIIPKYFFTEDGEIPCKSELVGPFTTRIKAMERNNHVLNHLLFWTDVLSMRKPTIELSLFYRTAMIIEKQPFLGIADFSIPGDPAIFEEVPVQQHTFSFDFAESESGEDDDEYYI